MRGFTAEQQITPEKKMGVITQNFSLYTPRLCFETSSRKRSLRVSLLSGIKKTGIPIFSVLGSRVESNFLICQVVLFLIPYRRLTLRSSYP
ncbi:MAG: hypothetical protein HUU50_23415 [Candidatus Brocadiae bacterium]|nr:hypothetical protein [Candidatus Brocadiia bacterium]